MIAASEPQEFIPSGRQRIWRHPGNVNPIPIPASLAPESFLLHHMQRITISETEPSEWWIMKESLNKDSNFCDCNKSVSTDFSKTSDCINSKSSSYVTSETSSYNWKNTNISTHSNSFSDINISKFSLDKSRVSNDNENKNETKLSDVSNKMFSAPSNLVHQNSTSSRFNHFSYGVEEELYIKGSTAIWSKGLLAPSTTLSLSESRVTLCSYTMSSTIKHALWCVFHSQQPNFFNLHTYESQRTDRECKLLHSICLVDSNNMRIFTENGEDFVTNLQFQISNIWNTKYGILLERDVQPSSRPDLENTDKTLEMSNSVLYSLAYPLNEIIPVLFRYGSSSPKLCQDLKQKVVFTSVNPSLCMLYDGHSGLHSVYLLRKIKLEETQEFMDNASKISMMTSNNSLNLKMHQHSLKGNQILNVPSAAASPFCSRAASISSLTSLQMSRGLSPMANISRCQSPCASPYLTSNMPFNYSIRLQQSVNLNKYTNTYTNVGIDTMMNFQSNIVPEICLEHVWSESYGTSKESNSINGPATQVFLSYDLVDQAYLCYLIPTKMQLRVARMEQINNSQLIIGVIVNIAAKSAIDIPHLHLIAIIEPEGHIILYSGLTILGKLHVAGIVPGLSTSPFLTQSVIHTNISTPFPRRSSLLPNFNTPEVRFDDSVSLLSPVHPTQIQIGRSPIFSLTEEGLNRMNITLLRDAVFDRITLQYSDGSCYRVRLPSLAIGSLTSTCLAALQHSLHKDLALLLISRWYTVRNAPGPIDMTAEQEWNLFSDLLLSLIGYNIDRLEYGSKYRQSNSPSAPKRQRTSADDLDWMYLLISDENLVLSNGLNSLLGINLSCTSNENNGPSTVAHINSNSPLFSHLPLILFTLHLVYEELKLYSLRSNELPMLVQLIHLLASDLRLNHFLVHYWLDYPNLCCLKLNKNKSQVHTTDLSKMTLLSFMDKYPVSIMKQLNNIISGKATKPYPFITSVNQRSSHIIQLTAMIIGGRQYADKCIVMKNLVKQIVPPGSRFSSCAFINIEKDGYEKLNVKQRAVLYMTEVGFTKDELESLPPSISLLLYEALWECRENPPSWWPVEAYHLIQRPDLAAQLNISQKKSPTASRLNADGKLLLYAEPSQEDIHNTLFTRNSKLEVEDGMEHMDTEVLRLRFPNDRRVAEVRRLLQSATPVTIRLIQRPEVTDHDFIEEQERHLFSISTRTMALPVGRGMFTLRTHLPVITEILPIPRLCLGGKAPPRGTAVELTHIDTPPNMNLWPLFHNGVAAGLRISPEATDIDSTWIIFNKPKLQNNQETPTEHAGFLMALGLNGHLKNLAVMNMYDYLVKLNEMTSLGLLLGLSATKRGTMDTATTKILSIHVEALLPPTSMELDIPQNVQVASLLGIGLVYQGSGHRHITEVLLGEIGRPPGPEMENSVDRESYSLAAGLALGLVTLGQGGKQLGLSDLAISDTLNYYMVGGNKRPLTGSQKEKYKAPSFQIREGHNVNLDVTAPGATLALGLMYLGSGSKAIADWMRPPDTQYLLGFVRPDLLLLRVVSRALILWNEIKPTSEWVEKQVPDAIWPYCLVKPEPDMNPDIDFEAMNQAYCNIVAGACFALGLRFAGSADSQAYKTLLYYGHMFTSLTGKSIAELAGKPTIETCLNLIILSLSMVMAGTGDLSVLRLIRHLRRRVSPASSATVPYGAHLALHMALGLLFLGAGRLTLSSSWPAVAAMLCAFFPKFPTHSNDNRYHLQAFRHLYVLAVELRLIIPRDILSGSACYTNLSVFTLDGKIIKMKAPCMLPELSTLTKIRVDDDRYWPIVFEKNRNWDQLLNLLKNFGSMEVKQKAGCLSYVDDPVGSQSLLAHTVTQTHFPPWDTYIKDISTFSSDTVVKYFIEQFLNSKETYNYFTTSNEEEIKLKQVLSTIIYECVTKDKLIILPIWIMLMKNIYTLRKSPNSSIVWQLKLMNSQIIANSTGKPLVSIESALSLQQQISVVIDSWEKTLIRQLQSYIKGNFLNDKYIAGDMLTSYITFYDIPYKSDMNGVNTNILEYMTKLSFNPSISVITIKKIIEILSVEK